MKRIKLILTAIAAIGIVGSTLAFKAKRFGNTRYCFAITTVPAAVCTLSIYNAQFTEIGVLNYKYVTILPAQTCNPGRPCTQTAKHIAI